MEADEKDRLPEIELLGQMSYVPAIPALSSNRELTDTR